MKKSVLVLIFISILMCISYINKQEKSLYSFSDSISYVPTFSEELNDINLAGVINGGVYHVYTTYENYKYVNNKYNDVLISETFVFDKNFNLERLLNDLNVKILNKYEFENKTIIEGYSNLLNKVVYKNTNKYNLQICISEQIKVGYPYILEGF